MPRAVNGMKVCSNPNCIHKIEEQPISNFNKASKNKDGLTTWCKDCHQFIHSEIPGCKLGDLIKCGKNN